MSTPSYIIYVNICMYMWADVPIGLNVFRCIGFMRAGCEKAKRPMDFHGCGFIWDSLQGFTWMYGFKKMYMGLDGLMWISELQGLATCGYLWVPHGALNRHCICLWRPESTLRCFPLQGFHLLLEAWILESCRLGSWRPRGCNPGGLEL